MTLQPNTPVYPWSQLAEFRAHILSLGGSSDVGSGAEAPSDVDISGRYARQYSAELPDSPGRTITFYCSANKPGTYGAPDYVPLVVLTGCPWGTLEERNATYRELALSGCRPNDMRSDSDLLALVEQAKKPAAATIRNLTPHAITIGAFPGGVVIAPAGIIARATEDAVPAAPLRISIPDPTGAPSDRLDYSVATTTTRFTGLVDLPDPTPGVYLIVSSIVAQVAAETGRDVDDLLVPGQQIRDASGRIVGCQSLVRCVSRAEPYGLTLNIRVRCDSFGHSSS